MSDKPKTLAEFVANALPVKEQPEPAGVVAARERQEALIAKSDRLSKWRAWDQAEHEPVSDENATGANFTELREACGLSIGDIAEVTGTSPSSVTDYEAGKQSFANPAYRRLLGSMHAAIEAGR